MNTLQEAIRSHFRPDERRRVEVPEWGKPAVLDAEGKVLTSALPLVITYMPVTLDDQAFAEQAGNGNRWMVAAHMVVLKACDANGVRLFPLQTDALWLRENAAPEVLTRLLGQMLGRITMDDAAKN